VAVLSHDTDPRSDDCGGSDAGSCSVLASAALDHASVARAYDIAPRRFLPTLHQYRSLVEFGSSAARRCRRPVIDMAEITTHGRFPAR